MGDSTSMYSTLLVKEERIQRLRLIKVVPQLDLVFWFHRNTAQKRNKQLNHKVGKQDFAPSNSLA